MAVGYLVAGWVLHVAGTEIRGERKMLPQHLSSRCWWELLLGSCFPALLLPLSYLQLPSAAASPLLPLPARRAGREPGTPAQRQSRPAFGCVPFPFPLSGNDTSEQLDLDRMP